MGIFSVASTPWASVPDYGTAETITHLFHYGGGGPIYPGPDVILLAAVAGPSPSISGPAGITWLPCGSSGRLALFYAIHDTITILPDDEAFRYSVTGRGATIIGLSGVDTSVGVGGMVNFASATGTLPAAVDPGFILDVENGPLSYDNVAIISAANLYHGTPRSVGAYGIPGPTFGQPDFGGFNSFYPQAVFPDPAPLPEDQETDECLVWGVEQVGCGDFLVGFDVNDDSSSPLGEYDIVIVYFVKPGWGTCGGGGGNPPGDGDPGTDPWLLRDHTGELHLYYVDDAGKLQVNLYDRDDQYASRVEIDSSTDCACPSFWKNDHVLQGTYLRGTSPKLARSMNHGRTYDVVAITGTYDQLTSVIHRHRHVIMGWKDTPGSWYVRVGVPDADNVYTWSSEVAVSLPDANGQGHFLTPVDDILTFVWQDDTGGWHIAQGRLLGDDGVGSWL